MIKEKKQNLKMQILHYQKTGEGLTSLCRRLAMRIYRYPREKMGWGHDSCSDFYLYIHPKMNRILNNYQDIGPPFKHYLHCVLRWQLLTYNRQRKRKRWLWHCSREKDFWNDCLESGDEAEERSLSPHLARILKLTADNQIPSPVQRRRFLLFCLKKSRSLNERHLQLLADLTGYDFHWLQEITEKLRKGLEPKENRLRIIQARKSYAFFQIRFLEKRLRYETCADKRQLLTQRLTRQRLTFARAAQAIAGIHLQPTHKAIAEATGHPKGTVDTDIQAFKQRLIQIFSN